MSRDVPIARGITIFTVQDGGQMRGERTQDRHQKVRQILEGNILAMPAGATHWIYNQGQSDLVIVSIVDLSNQENQLDQSFRVRETNVTRTLMLI